MIHVYGHSHVNQVIEIDGIRYMNNAFATPKEARIARKELVCILILKLCQAFWQEKIVVNLPENEIHIWQVALSDVDPAALTHKRWPGCRRRSCALREAGSAAASPRISAGKMADRICLSEYTGLAMGDWQFTYNAYGKPQPREGLGVQTPYFNLSHSHGRAVLAVGRTPELGVDIEFTGMKRRVAQIASLLCGGRNSGAACSAALRSAVALL